MKRNYIKFLGRLLARELRNDLANTDDGVGEQALARPAGWHHFADPDVELAVAFDLLYARDHTRSMTLFSDLESRRSFSLIVFVPPWGFLPRCTLAL
jgi:hypothetical protein